MDPAMKATVNAVQAHGRALAITSDTGRSLLPTPRRRRSIIATAPMTTVSARTCTVSVIGNNQVDSAMAIANGRCSSQLSIAAKLIIRMDSHVGDQAPGSHDANAKHQTCDPQGAPQATPARGGIPVTGLARARPLYRHCQQNQ